MAVSNHDSVLTKAESWSRNMGNIRWGMSLIINLGQGQGSRLPKTSSPRTNTENLGKKVAWSRKLPKSTHDEKNHRWLGLGFLGDCLCQDPYWKLIRKSILDCQQDVLRHHPFPKSFSHVLWEKNVARFEVGYLDVLGTNTVDLLHVGVRFVL